MMTVVQIPLASIFFGPYFRFAQMRPMTLAVCVNNLIFLFLISTRKSITYALLYTSATLNERIFSVGGFRMKKISLCSCNNSSGIFTISFLHHRHLHAITGTFSYLLKNTASCEGY